MRVVWGGGGGEECFQGILRDKVIMSRGPIGLCMKVLVANYVVERMSHGIPTCIATPGPADSFVERTILDRVMPVVKSFLMLVFTTRPALSLVGNICFLHEPVGLIQMRRRMGHAASASCSSTGIALRSG